MLVIDIPSTVYEVPGSWNGKSKKLITVPPIHLEMEHSLNSIAEWEAKYQVPYMEHPQMTVPEFLDYCRCMTLNRPQNPDVYNYIRRSDAEKIMQYIQNPMSARKIRNNRRKKGGGSRVTMTSEYFYYCMIETGIPFNPCAGWHFNRLMALLDCCQSNSGGGEKMSYRERQKWYAELNGQRRRALGSKG